MGKASKVVGIILIIIGLFYAAAPHEIHVSSGAGFGWDHTMHIMLGAVLIIIGLILIVALRGKKGKQQTLKEVPAKKE